MANRHFVAGSRFLKTARRTLHDTHDISCREPNNDASGFEHIRSARSGLLEPVRPTRRRGSTDSTPPPPERPVLTEQLMQMPPPEYVP